MTSPRDIREAEHRTAEALARLGRPVVVACSGGTDSSLLALLVAEAGVQARLVHVDHGLSSSAAAGVEAVRALGARCGLDVEVLRADGAALRRDPRGVEAAAREARYACLASSLRSGEVVVTAHTATDRLATMLMRLVQGAGVAALAGPAAEAVVLGVPVARPMLHWWRDAVTAALGTRGWTPHADPENVDPRYLRNRVETEVAAPLLALADPRVLERSLRRVAADAELLEELLARELGDIRRTAADGTIVVALAGLVGRSRAEQQALVAATLRGLPVRPSEATIERIVEAAARGGSVSARGLRVECARAWMRLGAVGNSRASLPALELPPQPVAPGVVHTCLGDLYCAVGHAPEGAEDAPTHAWLDADAVEGALTLRSVGVDERFCPMGRKTVSTVGAIAKSAGVPMLERRSLPAVCDDAGPLWIPGVRRAARALVVPGTARAWVLEWYPLGT